MCGIVFGCEVYLEVNFGSGHVVQALVPQAFQHLKGGYKKEGDRLFSTNCCGRTRRNDFKLKDGRFRLDTRKIFFTIRVVKH